MKPMMMLMTAVVAASPAIAQGTAYYVDTPVQGRENVSYAYADVLRAMPTYEIIRVVEQKEECFEPAAADSVPPPTPNGVVAESHDGAHALVISLAQEQALSPLDCRLVEVKREERRISGYDVEYRYKGQLYMSNMDYDPGNKLRIRVTVAPAD